jgi:1-aminocyclopropane-1-carboxylate deaminase
MKLIEIQDPLFHSKGVSVWMLLDYLNHPDISGNKWRKLLFNIGQARDLNKKQLITFGGAYSNHLFAFANACGIYGFKGLAIVRGDGFDEANPTLNHLKKMHIQMRFVSRTEYRDKLALIASLEREFPDAFIIPEGGTNEWAIRGFETMVGEVKENFDVWICPVGTGGTLAGISVYNVGKINMGIAVVNDSSLGAEIAKLCGSCSFQLIDEYTMGGYAKVPELLVQFINDFYDKTGIPLDPIYTGKMVYAFKDLTRRDFFIPGQRILMIHTGGLQGIAGFNSQTKGLPINFQDSGL